MLRARPRVVIDTNLWISFLIGKRLASLGQCLVDETVQITTRLDLCRDQKDNFLPALCVDSNADLLVTGDRDLLEIGVLGRTQIVTHKEFEELIAK